MNTLLRPYLQMLEKYHNFNENELPATATFAFLRQLFSRVRVYRGDKPYFVEEDSPYYSENIAHFQMLIEQYYKSTPTGQMGGFYLYRVAFSQQQIIELVQYWCKMDSKLTITDFNTAQTKEYPLTAQTKEYPLAAQTKEYPLLPQQKDLVLHNSSKKNTLVQNTPISQHRQLQENEFLNKQELQQATIELQLNKYRQELSSFGNPQSQEHYQDYIALAQKVSLLEQKLIAMKRGKSLETTKVAKRKMNLKPIFLQYARLMPARGDSFQNIEREAQSMNYQKLVHLLKDLALFPAETNKQKNLHKLFIHNCSNGRELSLEEFKTFIRDVGGVIGNSKEDKILKKIEMKYANKVKRTFPLKLIPIQGQFKECIFKQLEQRKRNKQNKQEQIAQKVHKKHREEHIIQNNTPIVPPIAHPENIELFRDQSFDIGKHFGITDFQEDIMQQMRKRVKDIQNQQQTKINSLLNSIIDKSDSKLQKLGITPKNSKLKQF